MDKYLGDDGDIDEILAPLEEVPEYVPPETEGEQRRPPIKMLPMNERLTCFTQVELGFDDDNAIWETGRCLRCDLEEQ